MWLGVGFSRSGVALLPEHGWGCVVAATAGARSVSIPSDRSGYWSGYILMTSAGGALANAVGALGNAGGALAGRGEVDDAAMLIWKGRAPRKGSGKAMMIWKNRALLLAGVVL